VRSPSRTAHNGETACALSFYYRDASRYCFYRQKINYP